jgi:hypothetical protein
MCGTCKGDDKRRLVRATKPKPQQDGRNVRDRTHRAGEGATAALTATRRDAAASVASASRPAGAQPGERAIIVTVLGGVSWQNQPSWAECHWHSDYIYWKSKISGLPACCVLDSRLPYRCCAAAINGIVSVALFGPMA